MAARKRSAPDELGREFAAPKLRRRSHRRSPTSFADPNSLDDPPHRQEPSPKQIPADKKEVSHVISHAAKHKNGEPPRPLDLSLFGIRQSSFILVLLAGWLPRHFRNKDNEKRAEAEQKNAKPHRRSDAKGGKRSRLRAGLVVPGTDDSHLTRSVCLWRAPTAISRRRLRRHRRPRSQKDQILAAHRRPPISTRKSTRHGSSFIKPNAAA